jgi:hypothetical protein
MRFFTKVDIGEYGVMRLVREVNGRNNKKITRSKMADGQKVKIPEMNFYGMR